MIESSLEDWACDKAEAAGWFCRKVKWGGRRNAPDRLFAKEGRVLFIEVKRPGETARPTQKTEIETMRVAGIEVHVCDNPLGILRILGVPYDLS